MGWKKNTFHNLRTQKNFFSDLYTIWDIVLKIL